VEDEIAEMLLAGKFKAGDTIAIRKTGKDLEFTKKMPRKTVHPKAVKEKVNA
jgi:ATP-dependent Clp protease ATP-binding subunit ClpC